ncbi:MAG: YDG domain-containing protein, partial [Pseudomonadota bacterium]
KNVGTAKGISLASASLSGVDASNYSITAPTSITANITAKTLTVAGASASNKVYDGTTNAAILGGSLVGVIGSEAVNFDLGSATFSDKNVGNAKVIHLASASLNGTDASNYLLTAPSSFNADITPKTLIVAGALASNKVYDGTTIASISGGSLIGIVGTETVNFTLGSAYFANKNVGNTKAITIASASLNGPDSSNYSVTAPTSITANISAKALTITSVSVSNKVYDGTTAASVSGGSLVGIIGSETVNLSLGSATFTDKNVGTSKGISLASTSLSGVDSTNYSVTAPGSLTANITAKTLTIAGASGSNKVYDGTTTASISGGSLVGVIGSEAVSFDLGSATFNDKNVGNAKVIHLASASLNGTDASNYLLTAPSSFSADIIPKALNITGALASNKVYDGTTAALVSGGSLVGIVGAEAVSFTLGSASFVNKNVGFAKGITIASASLTGADASNYFLIAPNSLTANITAKSLTIAGASASNKVYDGTTIASVSGGSLIGVIGSESVSLSLGSAAFADKNVGNSKAISVFSSTLNGIDASNYSFIAPTFLTADITPKALTIAGASASNKVYDGNTNAFVSGGSLVGIINSEAVNFSLSSATFSNKNVGTAKGITIASASLSGLDASNYFITVPSNLTADITAKALTVAGASATNKIYDGTNSASVSGGSLIGIIGSEDVNVSLGAATFADKNIGIAKGVTLVSASLSGADASNYSISTISNINADITAKALMIAGATASNKFYDGNTTASVAGGSLLGVIENDIVNLSLGGGTFSDKNVGNNKAVTLTGLQLLGKDALNYSVITPNYLTADIKASTTLLSSPVSAALTISTNTSASTTKNYNEQPFLNKQTSSSPLTIKISNMEDIINNSSSSNQTFTNSNLVNVNTINTTKVDNTELNNLLPNNSDKADEGSRSNSKPKDKPLAQKNKIDNGCEPSNGSDQNCIQPQRFSIKR